MFVELVDGAAGHLPGKRDCTVQPGVAICPAICPATCARRHAPDRIGHGAGTAR